jgi:hypothetical protein
MVVGAQPGVDQALPEVTTLVQRAALQQRLAESKERDYVFREHVTINQLRKECTWALKCPGDPHPSHPVGLPYEVLHYTGLELEIFWLDGIRVARVMPICQRCSVRGDKDWTQTISISESELAAENQRVDSEIAAAKTLRAKGMGGSSSDAPPQILFSRMLELCSFSNPRRQVIDGRDTVLLDFGWNSSANPASAEDTILKSLSGSVGIDEEDRAIQHVDGKFLADVELDGGQIKIRKGTRVTIENTRIEAGVWLLSKLAAWGEVRYPGFSLDGNGYILAGQYQKFSATSKILPAVTEVPSDSPMPPAPKPSHSPVVPR